MPLSNQLDHMGLVRDHYFHTFDPPQFAEIFHLFCSVLARQKHLMAFATSEDGCCSDKHDGVSFLDQSVFGTARSALFHARARSRQSAIRHALAFCAASETDVKVSCAGSIVGLVRLTR